MRIVKRMALICLLAAIGAGCKNAAADQAEEYFGSLNDNQAKALLTIGGKPFYPGQSVFTCQMLASSNVLSLTLTDQFDGRTMISIVKNEWYAKQPVEATIKAEGQGAASLKFGKLTDRQKLIGEGYMMTNGTISLVTLDREKMIFEIKGEAGPYSDFQAPDKLLPLEGIVICKRPAVSFGDVSEKEVFGSTHSN
ncbi:hypothetical protein [Dyadobacter sp. BHUBP1]|uniref:hypothetical protein n=1 Tax=Dyadobacter sp. BHUBP1 TaxID=3424178 RepID=UPI003D347344